MTFFHFFFLKENSLRSLVSIGHVSGSFAQVVGIAGQSHRKLNGLFKQAVSLAAFFSSVSEFT